MNTKITCPNCKESFEQDGVGTHWNRSPECTYPRFSDEQVDILTGILLVGGWIGGREQGNPYVAIKSTNVDLLKWVSKQFPILGTEAQQQQTEDEAAEAFTSITSEESRDFDASAVYRWQTRALPHVGELEKQWYGEEGRVIPTGLTLAPISLKLAFALRGRLVNVSGSGSAAKAVGFPLTTVSGTEEDWRRLLSQYHPTVRSGGDHKTLILRDAERFFEEIANTRLPESVGPLPGSEDRWPDDERLYTVDSDQVTCPECGSAFDHLGRHWGNSSCSPPSLTPEQHSFLQGMFIVGGNATASDDDSETARLQFYDQSKDFIHWLSGWLGPLCRRTAVVEGETAENPYGDQREVEFNDTYMLETRHVPAFKEFTAWYDDGEKVVPEDDIEPSSYLLAGMYAHRGRLIDVGDKTYPVVFATRSTASDDFLEDIFAAYNGEMKGLRDNSRTLAVEDAADFFAEVQGIGVLIPDAE